MTSEERGAHPSEDGFSPEPENNFDDDLRVRRSEEEARVGTYGREAGAMNVRKSVRTEREQVRVPKRREEIDIERAPVNREAPEGEIGEDEVVIQVFEEEVVVTKRIVLKEEIRIRKRVVEDEEIVDVDLRKEEVEIDDQTRHGVERHQA